MGYILAALRSMAGAADIRIQQPACNGDILYGRSVSLLDFSPFQFILYSVGHKVLQYFARKSAVALCDFSSNACAECLWSAVYSRDCFSCFGSGSNSWLVAVRFFLGDASFRSTALWNAQDLSIPGESFNSSFITSP